MLEKVKLALRITTSDFDAELTDLINAALNDLGIAGVTMLAESDPMIIDAVKVYCKLNWSFPEGTEYDRLKAAYDEKMAQLGMASRYTNYAS